MSELGGIEILARRFQLHEERNRLELIDTERGAGKTGIDYDDSIIFIGGNRDRGRAAMCPALLDPLEEASIRKGMRNVLL